jgi:hypothetical protein
MRVIATVFHYKKVNQIQQTKDSSLVLLMLITVIMKEPGL